VLASCWLRVLLRSQRCACPDSQLLFKGAELYSSPLVSSGLINYFTKRSPSAATMLILALLYSTRAHS
jgi:hypothetical protein